MYEVPEILVAVNIQRELRERDLVFRLTTPGMAINGRKTNTTNHKKGCLSEDTEMEM
jgi:hypothetical protein